MRDAAAENSISDVGLVKICKAAGIPTPPQGHWNKIRAGKRTFQTELPPRPPGTSHEVTFGGGNYSTSNWGAQPEVDEDALPPMPPVFEEELPAVLARIRSSLGHVSLPKTLASPHVLIGRLLDADEARRQAQVANRYPSSWDNPKFDSPFERRRLKMLNAIFVALAHENYKPSIGDMEARNLSVRIGGQHVYFDLDGASQKKSEGWRYERRPPPKFGPDEKLRLDISRPKQAPDIQWSWVDGERKVETQLTEIVVSLIYAGEIQYRSHQQHMYEWEVTQRQRRQEEYRKRREEAERQEQLRLEKEERDRVQGLFQEANNLRRAGQIREYVAAVQMAARGDLSLDEERLKGWSAWATDLADRLDPLRVERLRERFGAGWRASLSPST
jgi:hypothetical protein